MPKCGSENAYPCSCKHIAIIIFITQRLCCIFIGVVNVCHASTQVCKPVDGVLLGTTYLQLIPSTDNDTGLFIPRNYTKRITLSSSCNLNLLGCYVRIKGRCNVTRKIFLERNRVFSGGTSSSMIIEITGQSKLVGHRFTRTQISNWLMWQKSPQKADFYHIDISISEIPGRTCLVSPVKPPIPSEHASVIVSAEGKGQHVFVSR